MQERVPEPGLRPVISAEVAGALATGRPVVALESTLITHGLPWPRSLEVARAAEAAVRGRAAVPATVAVRNGTLAVGLDGDALEELARARDVPKASRQNLAAVLSHGGWAGTTVSATMIAARIAGIRVFATGGIGGVHRGALGGQFAVAAGAKPAAGRGAPAAGRAPASDASSGPAAATFDISADLEELARTQVLVVCSGPKSILDAGLTLEYLETRGVPVIGFRTDELAGFWSRESGLRVPIRCESAGDIAGLACGHWALPGAGGVLLAVPVPEAAALPHDEAAQAIERAIADSAAAAIHGPEATPWLLARVAVLTGGRSVAANVALIEHNASVAADVAAALATA